MKEKIEVIAITSFLLADSIKINLEGGKDIKTIFIFDNIEKFINSSGKIDLLITNYHELNNLDSLAHVKNIVNLTNIVLRNDEIVLTLPCKLSELLDIISAHRANNYIFININAQWIYDEQQSIIFDKENKIKFTEKENKIFKSLWLAPEKILYKAELLKNIWQRNDDAAPNTVEAHLYRLNQKLPTNISLQIHDDYYQLIS
jgi:hypothetical protein